MAEALIRVVDKDQPDPILSVLSSKRGDVISVCPDGWAWSQEERTNPDWRIVSVAGILDSAVQTMLLPDYDPTTGKVRRRRAWMVDLSLAPNPSLFTGARTQAIITMTKQQVQAMIVKKA